MDFPLVLFRFFVWVKLGSAITQMLNLKDHEILDQIGRQKEMGCFK